MDGEPVVNIWQRSVNSASLTYAVPGGWRPPMGNDLPPVSPEEQAYLDKVAAWTRKGASEHLRGTRVEWSIAHLRDRR